MTEKLLTHANSEKSRCSFSILMQVFHDRSCGSNVMKAGKDWLF